MSEAADLAPDMGASWGARAHRYACSSLFASGDDLAVVARLAGPQPQERVLDVAAGAGFAGLSVAGQVAHVTVTDLAAGMLDAARGQYAERGLDNADFLAADAQALPFADASFELVLCRIAPHHFPDPAAFVAEAARVLVPGGRLVVEDSVAPEDAAVGAFLDRVETLRDPTHGRYLPESEWCAVAADSGLDVRAFEVVPKRIDYGDWLARTDPPADARAELERAFAAPPDGADEALGIEREGSRIRAFTLQQAIFLAAKEEPA